MAKQDDRTGGKKDTESVAPSGERAADLSSVHSSIRHPQVAHEDRDVSVAGILWFGGGLIIATVFISLLLWGLFDFFAWRAAKSDPPPPPLAAEQPQLPPEPRLQGVPGHEIHPLEEMEQLRAAEDRALGQYGWVDQTAGKVRLPIDQAIDLLAQRGLPSRPPAGDGKAPSLGIHTPSDSSSGRTMERQK